MIFFLHIPKAGGCTVHDIILQNYSLSKTFGYHVYSTDKSYNELERIKTKPIDIIKGHFSFGFHNYFENQEHKYFTFLREPKMRIISHYYYSKRTKGHYLYDDINNKNISLKEYVSTDFCPEVENAQTKQIAGLYINDNFGYFQKPKRANLSNIELYDQAIANIDEHFSFVGIMEQFDKSVATMLDALNLKSRNCYYEKRNVNKNQAQYQVEKDISDIIKQRNQVDYQLYDHCSQILDKKRCKQLKDFSQPNKFQKIYLQLMRVKNRCI